MVKMLRLTVTVVLAVSMFTAGGCGGRGTEAPAQGENPPPAALVRVKPVELHTMNEFLDLPGNIEAENIANVLSTTEGKLTSLTVREGDKVENGQVVAMLSPLLREDIITAARLALQAKEQAVTESPDNGALRNELEQAKSDYQFAINQYREIPVTAPISGLISGRWADIGDMVPARFKMFEIQSNDNLIVKVPVSELDIRKLSVGQSVRIHSDACPDRDYFARIQRIHPRVDPQTRNATVEILLQDPCPQLRSGMFVRASFVVRTINDAVVVPVSAILERGQQRTVFIIDDVQAREVVIETGLETNGLTEVISGVSEGDRIVTEGQEQLRTGMRVRILEDVNNVNN